MSDNPVHRYMVILNRLITQHQNCFITARAAIQCIYPCGSKAIWEQYNKRYKMTHSTAVPCLLILFYKSPIDKFSHCAGLSSAPNADKSTHRIMPAPLMQDSLPV